MEESKDNIISNIYEYAERSTAHGVQYVCGKNIQSVRRVLWLVLLLLLNAGFFYLFASSLQSFLRYESSVSISVEKNDTFVLPAITICNLNEMMRSKLERLYPEVLKPLELMQLDTDHPDLPSTIQNASEFLKNITVFEMYDQTSHDINEMFVRCTTVGLAPINCSRHASKLFTERGTCYSFNSGHASEEPIATRQAGNLFGVSLLLDINPDEFVYSSILGTGMYITIHDQHTYPRLSQKSFLVSPGKQVFVSLQMKTTEILPYPYSKDDCVDLDFKNSKHTVFDNYPYSEDKCLQLCLLDDYEKVLDNCQIFYEGHKCNLLHYFEKLEELNNIQKRDLRHCNCPPTCYKKDFIYKVTNSDFGYRGGEFLALDYEMNVNTTEDARYRYTQINIFYDSMKYTKVVQNPAIRTAQLFSNLGGMMGLFLGASLITVLELLEFTAVLCLKKFKGRQRKEDDLQKARKTIEKGVVNKFQSNLFK